MLCKKNIMIINTSVSRVWITIFSMILLLEWLPCVCFFLIAPQFLSLTPFIPSKPLPNFFKGNINLLSMEQVLIFFRSSIIAQELYLCNFILWARQKVIPMSNYLAGNDSAKIEFRWRSTQPFCIFNVWFPVNIKNDVDLFCFLSCRKYQLQHAWSHLFEEPAGKHFCATGFRL